VTYEIDVEERRSIVRRELRYPGVAGEEDDRSCQPSRLRSSRSPMATFRPSQERCVRSLSPPTSSLDSSTGRLSRRAVRAAAPFNLTQFTIAVSPPSAPTPARQHFRSFRYTSNTVMIEFAPFEPARYTRSSLVWRCKDAGTLKAGVPAPTARDSLRYRRWRPR
jgi:hypothetical protein